MSASRPSAHGRRGASTVELLAGVRVQLAEAERQLDSVRTRYRLLTDLLGEAGVALFLLDRDGRLLSTSPGFHELLGLEQDAGREHLTAHCADEASRSRLLEGLDEGSSPILLSLRRGDGSVVECRLHAVRWCASSGHLLGHQGLLRPAAGVARGNERRVPFE